MTTQAPQQPDEQEHGEHEAMRPAPRLRLRAKRDHARINAADGMPPVSHREILVEHDVPVPMPDGVVLLADHYRPAHDPRGSVVLVRSPYGRREVQLFAQIFAERGHDVLIQSCRGTFGSGPEPFSPFTFEAQDGDATMGWVRRQPWATGPVFTFGPSYAGITQWALVDGANLPDAMTIPVSGRDIDQDVFYEGGGFSLETQLMWAGSLDYQTRPLIPRLIAFLRARRGVARAANALPVSRAARALIGHDFAPFNEWVFHRPPNDGFWAPRRFARHLDRTPPVTLLAGWQDLFLTAGMADYEALVEAGRPVRLLVGDWTHDSEELALAGIREALWAMEPDAPERPAISVEVTGGGGWRTLEHWPPESRPVSFALSHGGALVPEAEARTETAVGGIPTVRFRYDPADPTPSAGGRSLNPWTAGRRDQRARERRPDVVLFTTEPFDDEFTVIGRARARLALTSTNPAFDVFLRICDVDSRGVSTTVSDLYVRGPEGLDGVLDLEFPPMAHRFAAGHALRLQVSAGAHPLHMRNLGAGDGVVGPELVPSYQSLRIAGASSVLLVPQVPR